MAIDFLTKSRHGTVYYFRRRVPKHAQAAIGGPFLVRSLETTERRVAVIRARSLAVQTDFIFQKIFMAKQSPASDGAQCRFEWKLTSRALPFQVRGQGAGRNSKGIFGAVKGGRSPAQRTLDGIEKAFTLKGLAHLCHFLAPLPILIPTNPHGY
jgi:hypothetical protein